MSLTPPDDLPRKLPKKRLLEFRLDVSFPFIAIIGIPPHLCFVLSSVNGCLLGHPGIGLVFLQFI